MTTAFDLRTMALLLRQGARLEALSRIALLVASGWLVATAVMASHTAVLVASLVASLVAGVIHAWYGMRVGFDAGLFDAAADALQAEERGAGGRTIEMTSTHAHPDTASRSASNAHSTVGSEAATTVAAMLDASLVTLGLQPAPTEVRDWPARWAGASRLLRHQGLWLAAQWLALLFAFAVSLTPVASRTMPA